MKEDRHERTRQLIDRKWVEGLTAQDEAWLEAHLGECADCYIWANRTETALRTLISLPVAMPPGLGAATRLRVRREVQVRNQQRLRNIGLAVGCALSWILGVASAPLVWRVCAWLGTEFNLPRLVWVLAFATWWLVPAASAALLILWQRDRLQAESESRYRL